MSAAATKSVKLLLADDNPLIRDLVARSLEPFCEVLIAADGADALLKVIDEPPDVILCDYKMPGLNGRQLYDKLRGREQTKKIPIIFMGSRADIEEHLRPLIDGVEDLVAKPFFIKDLVRSAKKVIDRLTLDKMQKSSVRPGVIQGRLEEMSMMDLMQSLEIGQKSCKLTVSHGAETCEMFFGGGACKDAKIGQLEGEAAVYEAMRWPDGVQCPGCGSTEVAKDGHDETRPQRQRYLCHGCRKRFDDLTGTIFAGHRQPPRVWVLCLYFMGLNLSNEQIAQELGVDPDDAQVMAAQLREGIVQRKPEVNLSGEVECDEVHVVAGHKGHPAAVRKKGDPDGDGG